VELKLDGDGLRKTKKAGVRSVCSVFSDTDETSACKKVDPGGFIDTFSYT